MLTQQCIITVWADNADALAVQQAGTGALKTHTHIHTRTCTRTPSELYCTIYSVG